MIVCECVRIVLAGAVAERHGGVTLAAPAACAFVHRKSRNSAGGRTRANKSGGGVSPPWFVNRRFGRRFDSRSTPTATRVVAATPLQRRPPTRRETLSGDFAEVFLQVRLPNHGGLTPAARDACAFVHRKSRNSVGGRTRANNSGGVSPPGAENAFVGAMPPTCGILPTLRRRPHVYYAIAVASAIPEPRRAHARRSCERAFMHRKSSNSAGGRTRANKSGGRKPPVVRGNAFARALPRSLGRLPTLRRQPPLHTHYPTHSGLTSAALGPPRGDRT